MKSEKDIYHDGWIDFNKNGKKDVFEDPTQPQDSRIENLLAQMNVVEKTCQLATLYGYRRVLKDPLPTPKWKEEIWKDGIANIEETRLGIPVEYTNEGIRGANYRNSVNFPANISLGAAWNRVKFIEGLFDSPYIDPEAAGKEIGTPESKQLALRAARESLVLLKNDKHTLPLSKSLKRVLVCGPKATMP